MNKKQAQKQLFALYYAIYGLLILELVIAHLLPNDFFLSSNTVMIMQGVVICLLLAIIPTALKLYSVKIKIKSDLSYYVHWSKIQMILLYIPGFASGVLYYFVRDRSSLFCLLIAFVALIFSKPTLAKIDNYLNDEEIKS
ncbi:MAG: hypothetical protein EOL95_04410 [Bacteroidia bacterium]|nr:hypothetical protein [Bacteroidia bacterium]